MTGVQTCALPICEEGIKGLTLANAIMLSSWLGKPVELPLDEDLFYDELQKRVARSSFNGKFW